VTDTFVDTSALIALLDARDPRHPAVLASFRSATDDRLVTHGYVVAEAIAVARRRFGLDAAIALIDQALPALDTLPVTIEQHDEALRRHRASLPSGTSFVDQVSFVLIGSLGIGRALALDADFAALGIEVLPHQAPGG
jgi:predicted nucleic acid-binding protein